MRRLSWWTHPHPNEAPCAIFIYSDSFRSDRHFSCSTLSKIELSFQTTKNVFAGFEFPATFGARLAEAFPWR